MDTFTGYALTKDTRTCCSEWNFYQWVLKFQTGKLKQVIMSEPIPEDDTGPVKTAVGLNFNKVVEQNGKDTFIFFYVPWCDHCKKLLPVIDELAAKVRS